MKFYPEAMVGLAVIAAILIPMTGCGSGSNLSTHVIDRYVAYDRVIPPERTKDAADWIKATVEAANPKSDEEPEDNILQAERTALQLFGRTAVGMRVSSNGVWTFIAYEDLDAESRRQVDLYLASGKVSQ